MHWDKEFIYEPLGVSAEQIKPNALILGYPVIDLTLLVPAVPDATMRLRELVLKNVFGEIEPPQAVAEQYQLDLHVSGATPPTFIWHTADDDVVFALNALRFATALAEHQVPYELHIFETGIHGLSLADETTDRDNAFVNPSAQVWIELALRWLKRQHAKSTE